MATDARWQPLTPALLRELATEVRTFGREPDVWAVSPENIARRFEEAAARIETLEARLKSLWKEPSTPQHDCGLTGRNLDDPPCPACTANYDRFRREHPVACGCGHGAELHEYQVGPCKACGCLTYAVQTSGMESKP